MNQISKWVTYALLGFIFVAVLLHAQGFSTAAGTLFTGFNNVGRTLEGR